MAAALNTSVEQQGVVYGAAFDIPYAIGSVAIPLAATATAGAVAVTGATAAHHSDGGDVSVPAQVKKSMQQRRGVKPGSISATRKCTHHRYCYLRDGGSLGQDAFYRWLWQQQNEEGVMTDIPRQTEAKASVSPPSAGESPAVLKDAVSTPASLRSPSLLYASVECVVFLLPSSFPNPRRVLRSPPYIIEDDTWAEHVVEVQLHFLPHLCIPPVTVVHQALLERRVVAKELPDMKEERAATPRVKNVREVWVPTLLASTYGKPKQPPTAARVTLPSLASTVGADGPCVRVESLNSVVVAVEKVDTLRVYHPSVVVLRHFRDTLAASQEPILRELRQSYDRVYGIPNSLRSIANRDPLKSRTEQVAESTTDTPIGVLFLHPWSLPFESVIEEYSALRAPTAVAVLSKVLEGLKRERIEMETSCERSMQQIRDIATASLPAVLEQLHENCMKRFRKE